MTPIQSASGAEIFQGPEINLNTVEQQWEWEGSWGKSVYYSSLDFLFVNTFFATYLHVAASSLKSGMSRRLRSYHLAWPVLLECSLGGNVAVRVQQAFWQRRGGEY